MLTKGDADINILTPPLSPRQSRSSSDIPNLVETMASPMDQLVPDGFRSPPDSAKHQDEVNLDKSAIGVLICPFDTELVSDDRGHNQMFGSGAWSNVFKAAAVESAARANPMGVLTPPASPVFSMPVLVAVKKPARADAKPILRNEAAILSHLNHLESSRGHVVPFYGIIESDSSLVLGAIPLSLEDHIRRSALVATQTLTTTNMSRPVIGSTNTWLDLTCRLTSALNWLHERADVVHGDIKPSNILLEPCGTLGDGEFPFRPLFIDFSSSHRATSSDDEIPPGTLSAVTREYTAPELLKSSVLRDPKLTATKASDVFSMAITLLVAATGNTMVYDGPVFRRQAMATQGWQVIGFVRSGASGSRVPRQGVVERALDRAVLKHDMGRITAPDWLRQIEEMQKGEPTKSF